MHILVVEDEQRLALLLRRVDIYIHYLRDKIDQGCSRPLIKTVRGVGYKIEA